MGNLFHRQINSDLRFMKWILFSSERIGVAEEFPYDLIHQTYNEIRDNQFRVRLIILAIAKHSIQFLAE